MTSKLISAISALSPTQVWDVRTGEMVPDWEAPVQALLSYATSEVEALYELGGMEEICALPQRWKPAEHARLNGIRLATKPPAGVKAVSRIEKLVQEKLVSEVTAYVNNSNPRKRKPTFYPKINLGAVDKQMASLSVDDSTLSLQWKVWDREFLFEFQLPPYVLARDILKWSLPVVQQSRKTGLPVFLFAFEERPKRRPKHKKVHSAGVDLGRVTLFTAAVTNQQGRRVAHYTSSKSLNQVSHKRDRLIAERKQVLTKLSHYKQLNYKPHKQETLQKEADRLRSKIRRIGNHVSRQAAHELTRKLTKHAVNQVNLEDLSWVHGRKYGGRWNHAATQQAVTHSLAREGIKTVTVNPKNTSQHCHACHTPVTHNTKKRTVRCEPCQTTLDRDYNAAVNIANKTQPHPVSKRLNRDDRTVTTMTEVVGNVNVSMGVPLRNTT